MVTTGAKARPPRMRRAVTAVMSAVTLVVGLASARHGGHARQPAPLAAAGVVPAGIVDTGASSAAPTPSPAARRTAQPSPSRGTATTARPPSSASAPTVGAARTQTATATATAPSRPPASRTVTPSTPPRTTAPAPAPTSVTINGAAADTAYGPVQVQITVLGGRITRANAIVYPTESRRDQEINSQAIPALNSETLRAQSAQIDAISGASYTSAGYQQSLQSAIDAAHKAGLR
ncbi:MAG: hypothetical protein QOI42_296 [Frankiaceae bacterium]|nr:hypothetical protein [Frankiaceae bacterium]